MTDFYCDVAISRKTPVDIVLETDDLLAFHHCRVLTNLGEYQDSRHLHYHVAYGESYGRNVDPSERDTGSEPIGLVR